MFLPYLFRFFLILLSFAAHINASDEKERRYLVYGVNFGEGFNLRRDVYLRISNVVRQLREKDHNFVLVLPPWFTPHWRQNIHQARQWSEFFDLSSLNKFVPVMEFSDFLKDNNKKVDSLLYLQHYSEGWDGGEYIMKYDLRPCMEADKYFTKLEDGSWQSIARSLREATFNQLRCLSIQGESETLVKAILELEPETKSIFVDRVETILHDNFGDKFYWQARRSMRYAEKLRQIGDNFRQNIFKSTDQTDKTTMHSNWEEHKPEIGNAIGGNYLCVHWRRRDFVYAHKKEVPSIKGTASQISTILKSLQLDKVFVSTDAEIQEYRELNELLSESGVQVSRFSNKTLSEGAVSIVDQWICSHARYFIGTYVSTFSYRIHEDREILGFDPKTTFNRLCADNEIEIGCEQPAKWTIIYD